VQVAGAAGIPQVGSGISAIAYSLTVIDGAAGGGSAVAWPDGTSMPGVDNLNYRDDIRSSMQITKLGTNGAIDIYNNSADQVDFVIDVEGWYSNPIAPTISCPAAYARGSWTNALPSVAITCTVSMPNVGDPDGLLNFSLNGDDGSEVALSATAATNASVQVPAAAGWYDIEAESEYGSGLTGTASYQFGLNDGAPSALIASIEAANPSEFENVARDVTTTTAVAASTTVGDDVEATGTVQTSAADGVNIASTEQSYTDEDTGEVTVIPASSISMRLPNASSDSPATVESPGVVSWNNVSGFHTVAILKNDTSIQMNTVLDGPSSPTSFAYPVDVPDGGSLALEDSGAVDILDRTGDWVGGVISPWATDANGVAVPTHFDLNADTITQVIEPTESTKYPIVADPWFGHTLISKVKWVTYSKWSPTAAVYPTAFGRSTIKVGLLGEGAAWAEVKAKGGSKVNTDTMHVQFECHWDVVRYRAPNKPSWDLDSKRPDVSLTKEIAYKCNYPDGGEW